MPHIDIIFINTNTYSSFIHLIQFFSEYFHFKGQFSIRSSVETISRIYDTFPFPQLCTRLPAHFQGFYKTWTRNSHHFLFSTRSTVLNNRLHSWSRFVSKCFASLRIFSDTWMSDEGSLCCRPNIYVSGPEIWNYVSNNGNPTFC